MRYIVDPRQTGLFDPYEQLLRPEVLERLRQGWQGVMRHVLLEVLPVEALAGHRHETQGCPTKELYSVTGLLFLMEFHDWTRAQAADAYTLDLGVQYALNLCPGGGTMTTRTLGRYREILREEGLGGEIFERVTAALVDRLQINVREQRLDSTHVFSDMALFGRTQLMGVAVKRFLTQLQRHDLPAYEALPEDLRTRYAPSAPRLFGDTARDKASRRLLRRQVAEDMFALIRRFEEDERHNGRTSYLNLKRVFFEQCEVKEKRVTLKEKAGGRVMQNPSDPEATYDGQKGPGYQAQVAETCAPENPVQLITAAVPQTAADTDAESFVPVLEALTERGRAPESMLADTAYGSDSNVQKAQTQGVELVSPVNPSKRVPGKLYVEDFVIDPETEEVKACPAGHAPLKSVHDAETGVTKTVMDPRDCENCPHRNRCGVKGTRTRVFIHTPAERRRGERRLVEQAPEWRKRYAKRAGIEGLMSRLKRCTSLGCLRVRGQPAVFTAIYLKLAGWNLRQAAKVQAMREIVAQRVRGAYNVLNSFHITLKNALSALMNAQGTTEYRFCALGPMKTKILQSTSVPLVFEGGFKGM